MCVESGWFKHETGEHNILGIKALDSEPYSMCTTWEHYDGKDVTIQAKFKDFDSYRIALMISRAVVLGLSGLQGS